MRINVNIERLVLEGLSLGPYDRDALRATVESQIAGMLAQRGLPTARHSNAVGTSSSILLASQPSARALGASVGESVYNALMAGAH